MFPTGARLITMGLLGSLGAACGEAGGDPGGDSVGLPDARERSDAGPDPSCEPSEQIGDLPIAWSKWLKRRSNRVAFDEDGSIVVAMTDDTIVDDPSLCVELARFAPDGTELWRHPYDPSPPPADNYKPCPSSWDAIALGSDGAIVTIGDDVSPDQGGPTDIVVRKHDRDGNALWTYYNQNAPDGFEGSDVAVAVAVAPDGTIVAAGMHVSRPWVARLSPDGVAEWTWIGTGEASDIAVAADGTAFLSIKTDGPHRIVRLDPDGTATNIARLTKGGGPGVKLATTPDGGVVFVDRDSPPRVRKIDASGAIVWDEPMPFMADSECRPIVLDGWSMGTAVGEDGTIHVTVVGGIDTSPEPPGSDYPLDVFYKLIARFSGDGGYLSSNLFGVPFLDDMAIGPNGTVALTSRRDLIVSEAP